MTSRSNLASAAILLLALAASATSLGNGFAYDDRWIIVQNANVHDLGRWWRIFGETYWPAQAGNTLYRPLTSLAYAVQWAIGGGAPWPFHLVNVLLYAALSAGTLALARRLLPPDAAWLSAALFAVHPVHVEAVGNSIGQAELWTALAIVAAVVVYLRARARGMTARDVAALLALYLAACLFKEHGVILPALLLAAEATVVPPPAPGGTPRPRALWALFALLAAVGIAYVLVRARITGSLAGDSYHPVFLARSAPERWVMMLGVLPEIARLLVWPAELLPDYAPSDIRVVTRPGLAMLPGLAIVLGVLLLLARAWRGRRAPAVAFGLLWLIIAFAPTSNVLVATGVIIAERTLLLPSVGAMLAIAGGIALAARHAPPERRTVRLASLVAAVVLLAGVVHSARSQLVWRSTETVVERLLEGAPLNYKTHFAHGALLFEKGDARGGELEWRLAIRLFPEYYGVYAALAERYREGGFCEPALPLYRTALALMARLPQERAGYTVCLLRLGRLAEAREQARIGASHGQAPDAFRRLEHIADSAQRADSIRRTAAPGAASPPRAGASRRDALP